MNLSRGGNDDPAVIRFMRTFHALRNRIDDKPEDLLDLGIENESVRKLALDLENAARALSDAERRKPQLFSAPANPEFIDAWRKFEDRYSKPVSDLSFFHLLGIRPHELWKDGEDRSVEPYEIEADGARNDANALDAAMDFASEQISDETRGFDEYFAEEVHSGIEAWEKIAALFGTDIAGVLRRRALVPFVLIPRHVSNEHGSEEKLSLLTHLQDAQTAFICGAPFAALVLMRSILEVTLKKHYRAEGRKLDQLIQNCEGLPAGAPASVLDRLRKCANAVVHVDKDKFSVQYDLEKELLQYLIVLRKLIEGAPDK